MNFNNPRERILAIAVGFVCASVVLWIGWSRLSAAYTTRYAAIAALEKKIKAAEKLKQDASRAQRRMTNYRRIALPNKYEVAGSLYNAWLLECLAKSGLTKPQITAAAPRKTPLYCEFGFGITAQGDLKQVTRLLYEFYQPGYLHRITRFALKPVPETKLLDVSLTIHAVALAKAEETDQLPPILDNRLTLPDLAAYEDVILGRNLFGAPNHSPKLAGIGRKDATLQRELDLDLKATDPDPLDKLHYELEKSSDSAARLDPQTGRFRWTPRQKGEFEFVVRAIDDGIPSRSVSEKLVVRVNDPPPERPRDPPPPPKLAFDHAKYAFLTGVVSASGESEAWLHVRPTNQMLKLHLGDKFEVGSIVGTVLDIGLNDFTFETDKAQRRLVKGQVLDQAEDVSELSRENQ